MIQCRSTFVSFKVYVDDLNVFHVPFLHQVSTPNQHGTLETCIFVQFSSEPFNILLAARTCHSTSVAVCLCRCQCEAVLFQLKVHMRTAHYLSGTLRDKHFLSAVSVAALCVGVA